MVPEMPNDQLRRVTKKYAYFWLFLLVAFVFCLISDGLFADIVAMFIFLGASFLCVMLGGTMEVLVQKGVMK